MENRNCEILFEYLRSILYDPDPKELDTDTLDEPFQKLGMGLRYLDKAVREMRAYSADLSIGNLSGFYPGRDNFLCENLKNLHANLNHLTWQAKQVAAGDYSQHVSYLGEFSDAFNTMTRQLCERERLLKQEMENEKRRAAVMEGYRDLLLEMMRRSNEHILVIDAHTGQVIYKNPWAGPEPGTPSSQADRRLDSVEQAILEKSNMEEKIWEWTDEQGHTSRIMTALIEWQGRRAYAHIIRDVTEEKCRTEQLADQAYTDSLTQIGNRFYFKEQMEHFLRESRPFVFCYFDLDHLKHINDCFGHVEGDEYIRSFTDVVKKGIRADDMFARIGGDEFCAVFRDCPLDAAERKLKQLLLEFAETAKNKYPASFSYGLVNIPGEHSEQTLNAILARADAAMYDQKRLHQQRFQEEIAAPGRT